MNLDYMFISQQTCFYWIYDLYSIESNMNVRETSKYSLKPIYYTFLKMRCREIKKTGGILFLESPPINITVSSWSLSKYFETR